MLDKGMGPFGKAAAQYMKAGWPEVLPIWKGGIRDKHPMVKGYHGREGIWPDDITTKMWANRYKLANIALRLPRWVIGLDVDHYDGKTGGDTLYDLEEQLGYLLAGPMSTSRDDGVSGIRLFALPGDYAGANWPAQAGSGIDVITWYERYVICYPSVHKSGRDYGWFIEGDSWGSIPSPSDLPMLSEKWCEYLTGLAGSGQEKWNGKGYDGSAAQWLKDYGSGEPCEYIVNCGERWLDALSNGGSAHDSAKLAISQAIKAAAEGHTGINEMLWPVRESFIAIVSERSPRERRRGPGMAVREWRSLVAGAVAKYGGEVADEDSICDDLEGF
jgi:Bifunctional DNA primase/polymerase, N-terminal